MTLEFTPLGDDLQELLNKFYTNRLLIRCNGTTMFEGYRAIAQEILDLEVREDDTWVCTFPKAGTTWCVEMVWCIQKAFDFPLDEISQGLRTPFLEMEAMFLDKAARSCFKTDELEGNGRFLTHSVECVKEMPSPRVIKTHLPFNLLPLQIQQGTVKPKIIHMVRNPMDSCISWFHHSQLMHGFKGTLEDFADLFINDGVLWAPFWQHYLSYMEKKNECKILFLKYEDMLQDLPSAVRKTAQFFDKSLNDEQVGKICSYLTFENMRENKAANMEDFVRIVKSFSSVEISGRFLRNGTAGQWKSRFSEELVRRFKNWTIECLQGTDLRKALESYVFPEDSTLIS